MRPISPKLSSALRGQDKASLVDVIRSLGVPLTLTDGFSPPHASAPALTANTDDVTWLEREGYATLPEDVGSVARNVTSVAIERLLEAGLPAVFVYIADPLWSVGERLRACISELIGCRYTLIADVWAWRIEKGERGWPPHRGWSDRLDRRAPELVNAWVALSDVDADQSCIHVVPLDEDPNYPATLDRLDAPLQTVRALPLRAGSSLFWNANLLHWGGACGQRARAPRVSCSFSLVREDALERIGWPSVELTELSIEAKLDLIAAQIVNYGEGKADVSEAVLEWARATWAMSTQIHSLSRRKEP